MTPSNSLGNFRHPGDPLSENQEGLARYSCDTCRGRKVKCDRKKPSCRNCTKASQPCIYLPAKKRASGNQRFTDLAKRLKNMEAVVGLAGGQPAAIGPAAPSQAPALDMPSPIDEVGFGWDLVHRSTSTSTPDGQPPQDPHEPQQTTPLPSGVFSIFSYLGAHWVDSVVGDDGFSDAMSKFTTTEQVRSMAHDFSLGAPQTPPPQQTVIDCVNGYLFKFNATSPLFQQEEVLTLLDRFIKDNTSLDTTEMAAINMMLAYARFSGCRVRYAMRCEQHFDDALKALPVLLMSESSLLKTGILLSVVQYLVYSLELKSAAAILAATIQIMLVAGYHNISNNQGFSEESLRKQRLLALSFILDADISLRARKAPTFPATHLIVPPGVCPSDGCGVITFGDGSKINFLQERVALAKIQHKICSLLHTPGQSSRVTSSQVHSNISLLDHELRAWKTNLPELAKPQKRIESSDATRLTCLTVLHYTYFQLVISIHSMCFMEVLGNDPREQRRRAAPHVALCVGAARASILLLDYEHCTHPFTVSLLHQVSWSIDVLFINILQNRTLSSSLQDVSLIEKVMKLFEQIDGDHARHTSYRICKVFHKVALRAIHNSLYEVQLPKDAVVVSRSSHVFRPPESSPDVQLPDVATEESPEVSLRGAPANDPGPDENLLHVSSYCVPDMGAEWSAPFGFQAQFWDYFPIWTEITNEELDFMDFGH